MSAALALSNRLQSSRYTLRLRCRSCPGTTHVSVDLAHDLDSATLRNREIVAAIAKQSFSCPRCESREAVLTAYFPEKRR